MQEVKSLEIYTTYKGFKLFKFFESLFKQLKRSLN
jgi:hypothetical protein